MRVATCTETDVDLLERYLPTGRNDAHSYHLACQQADEAEYLVAWMDKVPVGTVVVTWAGFMEDAARIALPDCPEIGYLWVNQSWRGKGVGTALIGHAESRIAARGFRRAGLGVDLDNPGAARLYERLGYRDASVRCESRYTWYDDEGTAHDKVETNRYLVKEVAR